MGDLILFRPAGEARPGAPPSGGAEIVFFTGVRYERAREAPDAARPPDLPRAGGKGRIGRNRRRRGA